MAEYATSIEIDAPPAAVFEYLTTAAGMTAWMGQHAVLDPQSGGGFAVNIAGYAVRGQYLHVDPPRRVRVSWGVAGIGRTRDADRAPVRLVVGKRPAEQVPVEVRQSSRVRRVEHNADPSGQSSDPSHVPKPATSD